MMLDRDLFEFFEHTADAAFTVSDSGEICSWNGSAERLFGFARVEAIGKTCFELFQGRDCNVEIEVNSELTIGMTVVDWWRVTERPVNARVMRNVDADGFFELLTERFARL